MTISRTHCTLNFIVDGEDFQQIDDVIMTFGDCQNRSCINITIIDDCINEPIESFTYTLGTAPGF